MKPLREPAQIKPIVQVALDVANEHIEHMSKNIIGPYETIDVLTRLRAAICLAEEAGLSTEDLLEKERTIGQR